MRVVVMGAGALGGYYAGMLARAGHEVICIARGAHLEAMQANGLTIKPADGEGFTVPVTATDDPSDLPSADLILFCVKTYDTDDAARNIAGLVGQETMVLSLQNGVDNEERLAEVIGPDPVLGAVAYRLSRIERPGVIVEGGIHGSLVFGELNGAMSDRAEFLLRTFEDAQLSVQLHEDVTVAIWLKFMAICSSGSSTALMRLPLGNIFGCPESREFVYLAMCEIDAVARAVGVNLPEDALERQWRVQQAMSPTTYSSMYFDLAAGKRLELEALNGTVVRLGRDLGVPTPHHFAIYAALKPYADGPPALSP